MGPVIDLAPGAETTTIARQLAELIRANIEGNSRKRRQFESLRGAVAMMPKDDGTITLRFDFGRLIIHSGIVGIPDVTLHGTSRAILGLAELPGLTPLGLAVGMAINPSARRALQQVLESYQEGQLKIYGLWLHPRLVSKVLLLLSKTA